MSEDKDFIRYVGNLSVNQEEKLDNALNKILVHYTKVMGTSELQHFYPHARRDLACAFWQVYEEIKRDDPLDLNRYGGDIPEYMGGGMPKKPDVVVTCDNKTTPYEHPISGGTTKTYKK